MVPPQPYPSLTVLVGPLPHQAGTGCGRLHLNHMIPRSHYLDNVTRDLTVVESARQPGRRVPGPSRQPRRPYPVPRPRSVYPHHALPLRRQPATRAGPLVDARRGGPMSVVPNDPQTDTATCLAVAESNADMAGTEKCTTRATTMAMERLRHAQ